MKAMGRKWSKMSDEQKAPYVEMSLKDQLRFAEELDLLEDIPEG